MRPNERTLAVGAVLVPSTLMHLPVCMCWTGWSLATVGVGCIALGVGVRYTTDGTPPGATEGGGTSVGEFPPAANHRRLEAAFRVRAASVAFRTAAAAAEVLHADRALAVRKVRAEATRSICGMADGGSVPTAVIS